MTTDSGHERFRSMFLLMCGLLAAIVLTATFAVVMYIQLRGVYNRVHRDETRTCQVQTAAVPGGKRLVTIMADIGALLKWDVAFNARHDRTIVNITGHRHHHHVQVLTTGATSRYAARLVRQIETDAFAYAEIERRLPDVSWCAPSTPTNTTATTTATGQ